MTETSEPTDLVGFLQEQLDEEEAAHRALIRGTSTRRWYSCDGEGCMEEATETWADGDDKLPNHHSNWSLVYEPHKALADVEAKRRILDEHYPNDPCDAHDPISGLSEPCTTILLLALPYADHGYGSA